jgi:lia operon protein LiaF
MGKTVIGLILLLLGALFLLANIGVLDFHLGSFISKYWPMLLILYGLKEVAQGILFAKRRTYPSHWSLLFGIMVLILGVVFQLNRLDVIEPISWSLIWNIIWPLAIIYIGIRLLFGRRWFTSRYVYTKQDHSWDSDEYEYGHSLKDRSFFAGSVRLGRKPWQLEDTVISMFAGEIDLDLTTAILEDGETRVMLKGFAGEITIYIPEDLPVQVDSKVLAGEINVFDQDQSGISREINYTSYDYDIADKKLHLVIYMTFGEINIKRVH